MDGLEVLTSFGSDFRFRKFGLPYEFVIWFVRLGEARALTVYHSFALLMKCFFEFPDTTEFFYQD
jgi:hypothetical protein